MERPLKDVAVFGVRGVRSLHECAEQADDFVFCCRLLDGDGVHAPYAGAQLLDVEHRLELFGRRTGFQQADGNGAAVATAQRVHYLAVRPDGHQVFVCRREGGLEEADIEKNVIGIICRREGGLEVEGFAG